jgi:hypothetical protein
VKKAHDPWAQPAVPLHITLALKALSAGNANEGQQIKAIKWIVEDCCRTYDWPYRPASDRDTCIALGMQLVGKHIVHEINLNPALLRSKNNV